MTPKPTFLPSHIQSAYQLRYRFGWCTKGRKPILSSSTIRSKVEVTIREVAETNCRYHNQDNASQIRKSSHAAIQYNIHFVFSVRRRIEFLDPFVWTKASPLLAVRLSKEIVDCLGH